MASNNTIKINLDFSANTQNAKSAIQDLSNSLNSITTSGLKGFGDATVAEIQKGQDAAARLKAILNESFNVNTGKLDLGHCVLIYSLQAQLEFKLLLIQQELLQQRKYLCLD